jgi:hypothetical protein
MFPACFGHPFFAGRACATVSQFLRNLPKRKRQQYTAGVTPEQMIIVSANHGVVDCRPVISARPPANGEARTGLRIRLLHITTVADIGQDVCIVTGKLNTRQVGRCEDTSFVLSALHSHAYTHVHELIHTSVIRTHSLTHSRARSLARTHARTRMRPSIHSQRGNGVKFYAYVFKAESPFASRYIVEQLVQACRYSFMMRRMQRVQEVQRMEESAGARWEIPPPPPSLPPACYTLARACSLDCDSSTLVSSCLKALAPPAALHS